MKKKIISIAVLLIFANNIAVKTNYPSAEEKQLIKKANYNSSGTNYNISGLGYGYDLIKSGYNNPSKIKTESDIFQDEFLNDRINNGVLNNAIGSSEINIETSNTYEEMINKFNISVGKNVDIGLNIELLDIDYSAGFKLNNQIDYSTYLKKFFYHNYAYYQNYNFSLKNTADLDLYRGNLNTNFVNKLDMLFNGSLTYDQFVGFFGTHVLTKATYGASLDLYYQLFDNSTKMSANIEGEISNNIGIGIPVSKEPIGSTGFYLGFGNKYSVNKNLFYENFSCVTAGGAPFASASLSTFESQYNSWARTIDTNPAMVNMDNLIPIWELLPQKYNDTFHKSIMRDYFFNYANINKNDDYLTYDKEGKSVKISDYRGQKYIINDEGHKKNNYDMLVLPSKIKDYLTRGFTKANISISFTLAEILEGIQEVYFYKSKGNIDTLLSRQDFIYGSKGTTKKESTMKLNYSVDLTTLENFDSIKVKYGAHGDWDDDWYNYNATLQVDFSLF